ncbi:MAG: hypothetical protein PVG14_00075 [Anaerolineales bacterium]|jgi:hypothetical protein
MKRVQLREICHARSGDKGDTANIGLIVYDKRHYKLIKRELTTERVKTFFEGTVKGEVKRYELPRLGALNFVLHNALDGGATRTLALDAYGKALSSVLLSMEIEIPDLADEPSSA